MVPKIANAIGLRGVRPSHLGSPWLSKAFAAVARSLPGSSLSGGQPSLQWPMGPIFADRSFLALLQENVALSLGLASAKLPGQQVWSREVLDDPHRPQPVRRSRNVLQCLPIFAHSGAGIRDHISSQIPVPKMGPPCCRTIRFTTKGRSVVPFSVPESGPRNGPAFRPRRVPKSRSQGLQKPAPCRRNLAADGWQTSHVAKSHWAHEKRLLARDIS